jgi:hypothetical protein
MGCVFFTLIAKNPAHALSPQPKAAAGIFSD